MSDQPRNRKPTRLPEWDYSTLGYYFVTINAREMVCLLGEVVNERVVLSPAGEIAQKTWLELPDHHDVGVNPFIVMPNHVHGIIEIRGRGGLANAEHSKNPPDEKVVSLTEVIRGFKT